MTNPVYVARGLAAAFAARAEAHDRDGSFPKADVDDLRASGLFGLMVPTRLGGGGADFHDYVQVARELAMGNGATALIFNMHASVTGALATVPDDLVRSFGAPEAFFDARDELLQRAADGALLLVAMSEPGVGSRFSAMKSTYEPTAAGWRIRGHKSFCSGAGHADAYLVVARSLDGERTSQFVVPAGEGVTVEQTWDSLGMRATASHDIHLDVEVPESALLGGVEGLAPLVAKMMPQWLVASYAAVYVGVGQAAIAAAVADLQRRGLVDLPAVRARIGRADAELSGAWAATMFAALSISDAPATPETNAWVFRSKLLAGDAAMRVAASMVEACGGSALRRGHPLERLFRDARCGSVQPATSDVCAQWLGATELGVELDGPNGVHPW
ncbi:MAG: Acyl-CoA dehydrogenase type 2 domain protein [Actinomycetia bacterium]|nr:Acyl-CoA dehydrogenase type 2 domain protein [Actinomycetes bacterium]